MSWVSENKPFLWGVFLGLSIGTLTYVALMPLALVAVALVAALSFVVWKTGASTHLRSSVEVVLWIGSLLFVLLAYSAHVRGTLATAFAGGDFQVTTLVSLTAALLLFWVVHIRASFSNVSYTDFFEGLSSCVGAFGLLSAGALVLSGVTPFASLWIYADGHMYLLGAFAVALIGVWRCGLSAAQWAALGACLVSAAVFMGGPYITSALGALQDEYPTWAHTYYVASAALGDSVLHSLVGYGPNSFTHAWSAYVPQTVNATSWWATSPLVGRGLLLTIVVDFGLLGACTLLGFLLWFLLRGAVPFSGAVIKPAHLATVALHFYIVWLLVAVPITTPLLLVVVYVVSVLLVTHVPSAGRTSSARTISPLSQLFLRVMASGLLIVVIFALITHIKVAYEMRAMVAHAAAGTLSDEVFDEYAPKEQVFMTPLTKRLTTIFALEDALSQGSFAPEEKDLMRSLFAKYGVQYAQMLRAADPRPEWIVVEIQQELMLSDEPAVSSERDAEVFRLSKPQDPRGPYLLALIHMYEGDVVGAFEYVTQAISLKPDFVPAHKLLEEIEQVAAAATQEQSLQTVPAPVDINAAGEENP